MLAKWAQFAKTFSGQVTSQTKPVQNCFGSNCTMYVQCTCHAVLNSHSPNCTNPNLWTKVEPEPKINNFGSATLRRVLIIYFFENQQNILIILVHHVFLCVTVQDSILYTVKCSSNSGTIYVSRVTNHRPLASFPACHWTRLYVREKFKSC